MLPSTTAVTPYRSPARTYLAGLQVCSSETIRSLVGRLLLSLQAANVHLITPSALQACADQLNPNRRQ